MKLLPVILASLLAGLAGGCRTAEPPPVAPPLVARVFMETLPPEQGVVVTLPVSGVRLSLDPRPLLLEFDVAGAELVPTEFGPALQLSFAPPAARDLYRKTAGAQGRRLVLSLNGAAMAALRIDDPVTGGTLLFHPEVRAEELPTLLADLQRTTAAVQAKLSRKK